jgi:hypothetical protein
MSIWKKIFGKSPAVDQKPAPSGEVSGEDVPQKSRITILEAALEHAKRGDLIGASQKLRQSSHPIDQENATNCMNLCHDPESAMASMQLVVLQKHLDHDRMMNELSREPAATPNPEVLRGGSREPYCSEECYRETGRALALFQIEPESLDRFVGGKVCARCQKHIPNA